jgi:poly-D-alanine transfer protein DltD
MKAEPKRRTGTTNLVKEGAFLFFLAHNNHEKQTKRFLKVLPNSAQYKLLQELAINLKAGNIVCSKQNEKHLVHQIHRKRLEKLSKGLLKKKNLPLLYPALKVLARITLAHHNVINTIQR